MPEDIDMLPLWKASELAQGPQGVERTTTATLKKNTTLRRAQSAPTADPEKAGHPEGAWANGLKKPRRKDTFNPEQGTLPYPAQQNRHLL